MLKIVATALALCLVCSTPAVALSKYEINTFYYDECGVMIGEKIIGCNGGVFYDGQQSGQYKLVERVPCDYGLIERNWYYWNGSGWTWFPGPAPTC